MTEPDLPPHDGAHGAPHDPATELSGAPDLADGGLAPETLTHGDGHAPTDEGAPAAAPETGKKPSYLFLAIISTLSVVADLGTKIWAEKTLVIGPAEVPAPRVIIKGVLTFFLAKNRGGAWGFLQHQPEKVRKPFFVLVSLLAIALLVGLYRRVHPEQKALKWGLPLVFGGAVGNLVDRIRYGHVIDFIDVQATYKGMAHHWPTFNVADIAICVGVGLMAIDMFTPRKDAVSQDALRTEQDAALAADGPTDGVVPMDKPADEERPSALPPPALAHVVAGRVGRPRVD
jgi:signal peptidase II